MAQPVDRGPDLEDAKEAVIRVLQYRALEDLSRGWRIVQPNLEQTGSLKIRYAGLDELAADEALWAGTPRIADAMPDIPVVENGEERGVRLLSNARLIRLRASAGGAPECGLRRKAGIVGLRA